MGLLEGALGVSRGARCLHLRDAPRGVERHVVHLRGHWFGVQVSIAEQARVAEQVGVAAQLGVRSRLGWLRRLGWWSRLGWRLRLGGGAG